MNEPAIKVGASLRSSGSPGRQAVYGWRLRPDARGTAAVTVAEQLKTVHENESIYIPIGSVHRLANPGLCTYATEEKLFSVIVVDDEATYDEWVKKTNAYTAGLKIRRIVRVLDPSLAE